MSKGQVLILDCLGDTRPVICFSLEVAGYKMRVLTDENEAINLLDNTRLTGEHFIALLVNNPYLNIDITKIIAEVQKIDSRFPIIFAKDSENLKKIVEGVSTGHSASRVYAVRPTEVVEALVKISTPAARQGKVDPTIQRAS